MANEKDAVVDFLNSEGVKTPDIFKETPQEEISEEAVEEKPLPFHKDPKVQKYVDKQIAKALEGIKPSETQKFEKAVSSDVDDVVGAFTTIIGNDTPEKVKALDALRRTLDGSDERASKKAIERFQEQIQQQEQATRQADAAAVEELTSGFEQIEEDYGVDLDSDTKTRAAFIEYLRKISPKNAEGEVKEFADIPSAWETFQERTKPQPQSRAKQLAARGMSRSTEASVVPTGKSWKDVDRYFDSLKKTLN